MEQTSFSENVILADAAYIDQVAFNLIVNFERMLGRRIPQADMARWAECVALDGGVRERPASENGVEQQSQLVLVYDHQQEALQNFVPARYRDELNGKAFRGRLGEFVISAVSGEGLTTQDQLFLDTLQLLLAQRDVRRLMVVPSEKNYQHVVDVFRRADNTDVHATVLAMQPQPSGPFRQEILGYSLMAALGIRGDEIHPSM